MWMACSWWIRLLTDSVTGEEFSVDGLQLVDEIVDCDSVTGEEFSMDGLQLVDEIVDCDSVTGEEFSVDGLQLVDEFVDEDYLNEEEKMDNANGENEDGKAGMCLSITLYRNHFGQTRN